MDSRWPIHTLVFDLDDTLFAEREYVICGFQAVDAWLREHKKLSGFEENAKRLFADGCRGKIFDEALSALGQVAEPDLIHQLVTVYRANSPKLTLLPDALEILDWAVGRFRLGLVSDGFLAVQKRKLESLGISNRFMILILTDALGRDYWKPHQEAFRRVIAALPGQADGFAYIADNPKKDFIAPRALGWRTVRVRRAYGEYSEYQPTTAEAADVDVTSLLSLQELLKPAPSGL